MLRSPRILPRKSLGQNFLRDPNIGQKIVAAINPRPHDLVLEIGPGEGALTRGLAATGASLIVVDIDARVIAAMHAMFPEGKVEIRQGDFLDVDLPALASERSTRLRIVGNIPYNITSPILFHVLDHREAVTDMTIMVQKEVARRMTAAPRSAEYGILSVMCGWFTEAQRLFDVAPGAFFPRPRVMSTVVRLTMRARPPARVEDERFFRAMVRSVFGKRRKTLRNSLAYFGEEQGFAVPPLPALKRRPEELSIPELAELSNQLWRSLSMSGGDPRPTEARRRSH